MSLRRAVIFVAAGLGFVGGAACSSEVNPGETGGSGAGSSASSGGGAGAFDPGGELTTFDSGIGPVNVSPGSENTQCITVRLHNPEGAFVRRFRADLGEGSHHMIVYVSDDTVEKTTPQDCAPFSGILNGEHPVFIAQQAKATLDFPTQDGVPVGFEIAPNQMLKIELHYIDTTDQPLGVNGGVHFDTIPLGSNVIKSDLAFWGTGDIDIPPNGSFDTGVKFQKALADTRTFALTTHQHHLGTRMRVWYAANAGDTAGTPVADGKNWSDPPLEIYDPPLSFDASGKGFAFECEWQNNTPNHVGFGEGFNDEMCFLWHYYYPSQGFQSCFGGFCKIAP